MNWWEWWITFWGGEPLTCQVPWWPLRQALNLQPFAEPPRILVLGEDVAGITELLVYRGLPALGVDPITQRVWGAPEEMALVRFVNQSLVLPEHQFDLVLAHAPQGYRSDLQQTSTYLQTAQLMSSLKAGGQLSLLIPHTPTWNNQPAGHLRSCFRRHFQAFPVTTNVQFLGEGWHRLGTWRWVTGQHPRTGHYLIQAQAPETPLSKLEWQSRAAQAGRQGGPPCCLWTREQQHASQAHHSLPTVQAGAA